MAFAVLLLVGCVPVPFPKLTDTPQPAPSSGRIVNYAQLTAKADAAFTRFWQAVAAAHENPTENTELLRVVTTGNAFQTELDLLDVMAGSGSTYIPDFTTSGTQFDGMYVEHGKTYLLVTSCIDHTAAHFVDAEGERHPLRPETPRTLATVTFDVQDPDTFDDLRVARWVDSLTTQC